MAQAKRILIEVSPGELIDKLTILEIKSERIRNAHKLSNVLKELYLLKQTRREFMPALPELEQLVFQLKKTNESLWEVEERIRDCEHQKDFGHTFIELARSVYRTNDHRSAIKRQINQLIGARFMEEKSFLAPDP